MLGRLKGLKVDYSLGPKGLHPKVPKEMALEIVEARMVIFQESLVSSSFRGLKNCKCFSAVQVGSEAGGEMISRLP